MLINLGKPRFFIDERSMESRKPYDSFYGYRQIIYGPCMKPIKSCKTLYDPFLITGKSLKSSMLLYHCREKLICFFSPFKLSERKEYGLVHSG